MSDAMVVRHLGEDRFAVEIRGHTVTVDQPIDLGGKDMAPTPTELFIASLASCVGFYARRYLVRHDLPSDGLSIQTEYTLGGKPGRVSEITIRITPPSGLPAERRGAFLAVASHCTVHNTLRLAPTVDITLDIDEPASDEPV